MMFISSEKENKFSHPEISAYFAMYFKSFFTVHNIELTLEHLRKENIILNCSLGLCHIDL